MKKDIIDLAMILASAAFFFGIMPVPNLTENHPDQTQEATSTPVFMPIDLTPVSVPTTTILTPMLKVESGESDGYKWPGELMRICSCESTGKPGNVPRHFDPSGEVLRGKINQNDVGMCQINLTYHEAEATRLGLNLLDQDDNFTYAVRLYESQGSQPWSWSRSCWGQ